MTIVMIVMKVMAEASSIWKGLRGCIAITQDDHLMTMMGMDIEAEATSIGKGLHGSSGRST